MSVRQLIVVGETRLYGQIARTSNGRGDDISLHTMVLMLPPRGLSLWDDPQSLTPTAELTTARSSVTINPAIDRVHRRYFGDFR